MTIIKADLLTAEEMAEYEAENGGGTTEDPQ